MYVLYTEYMQWPLEVHGINIVSEISPYGQTINRHRINLFVIMTQWIIKICALQRITHEEHYPIVLVSYQIGYLCRNVKNNLFLKSYGPMASFHKVIKLLKFKSAANLHCFQWKAQSRERILLQNLIRSALSMAII